MLKNYYILRTKYSVMPSVWWDDVEWLVEIVAPRWAGDKDIISWVEQTLKKLGWKEGITAPHRRFHF